MIFSQLTPPALFDLSICVVCFVFFFFFNDTATTEFYTLSLHDALPISRRPHGPYYPGRGCARSGRATPGSRSAPSRRFRDRKSTRLNSSHTVISYAVFCLKKKKENEQTKNLPGIYTSQQTLITMSTLDT